MAGVATEREAAAIVIFAGRYYSGMPYEDPATVFLKVDMLTLVKRNGVNVQPAIPGGLLLQWRAHAVL